ncbi:WD40 repeat domain-containing protein, partial [bacterium]|nr:WD40 repeat domain-containing protein [bacterium]
TTGKERTRFEADPAGLWSLALSPDGTRVAVGGRGKSIQTRLPDGRTQYSSTDEHRTVVWDVATAKVLWGATVPGSSARPLAFSPDGRRLAELVTEKEKAYVRVWDAADGKNLGRVDLPTGGHHLAFDRTGRRLAVSHRDTTATLYDLDTALRPGAAD